MHNSDKQQDYFEYWFHHLLFLDHCKWLKLPLGLGFRIGKNESNNI